AVLHASQLVTLQGPARPRIGPEMIDLAIIKDGGMLIRAGLIETVATSEEIERNLPNDAEVVDATGRVVLPGFVDAHAHPVFGGNRVDEFELRAKGATYEQIAAGGGGIRSTVRKTRAASEDELLAQAKKHALWFLKGGTTTVEAKSGYGLTVEDELKILRVIRRLNTETPIEFVPTFLGAHAIPDEFKGRPDQYGDCIVHEMLPQVVRQHLAESCDIFCEQGYFDAAATRRILGAAKAAGLMLRMHADQLTNSGGAALAAELGAVTADHLEQTDEAGIAALQKAAVQPVLLPGSVYALGKTRYPKARAMIESGLAVVLATDFNPGSSPTPSIQMILSLAVTQMKMTPAEAVTAATINAAYSLRRGDKIGSLEKGKMANFSIFDCEDYRELAYYFGLPPTHAVYVRGRQVYPR
ncbi:MAG TPA: imidazolonepropionase, partial [Chthoniobacterales bacterium]|nr:imidazolonepropionase [Chthoniobacterales bacterium]